MKIIDLVLNIDGLILDDYTSLDDYIDSLNINSTYPLTYQVLYEEEYMGKNIKGVYSTMGASNHSERERERDDFYSTDPLAITLLHRNGLLDDCEYWECACGNGNLSKELLNLGYNVSLNTDLFDRGYGVSGVNFLECTTKFNGSIITNPPFKDLTDFILKGLELSSNKLYIFARIQTLETIKRWESIFMKYKPLYVCPFVKRIGCYPNGDESYKNKAVCFGWFIWDVNNLDCETKVKWLL